MLTKLPKAIIFDMDDTILSNDESAGKCWRQVCHDFGHRLEVDDFEILSAGILEIDRWFWADPERSRRGGEDLFKARRDVLSMAFDRYGIEDEVLLDEMAVAFQQLKTATIELFPGALDALHSLRSKGLKLGLITNGNAQGQRAKVKGAGLEPIFDNILIEGEFGVGKPDPQVFLHTLEQLEVTPDEAWMVGDNLVNDVGGAQAVGICGVWVDWRGVGLPENSLVTPDRTIRSVVELVN